MNASNRLFAEASYQTDEVTVRFLGRPGDEDLRRFVDRHGLRLLRRNELVAEQAVFQPLDGRRDLADLVEAIEREAAVRAAWANTASQYQRAAVA